MEDCKKPTVPALFVCTRFARQVFVLKCAALDRQLSKLDRFETQIAAAKGMLSAVEKAVNEKCTQR